MLGSIVTGRDGSFSIGFDADYFGDYGGDVAPDVFFRVYRDDRLIKSTQDEPRMNVGRGTSTYVIEIDLGTQAPAPEPGRDRVSAATAFKAANFIRKSDFRGVARDQGDKLKMAGNFMGAIARQGLAKFNFEPVRPEPARPSQIVGQDTNTATRNLAANRVDVAEVRAYDPSVNRESVQALTSAPVKVNPQDKVVLYQENGVVRYYSVQKPVQAQSVDAATVARLDADVSSLKVSVTDFARVRSDVDTIRVSGERERAQLASDVANVKTQVDEVGRLQLELNELRQATASKDVEIARLREDMQAMQKAQADFVQRVSPEKLRQIEDQIKVLGADRLAVRPNVAEGAVRTDVAEGAVRTDVAAGAVRTDVAEGAVRTDVAGVGVRATEVAEPVAPASTPAPKPKRPPRKPKG
jgi:hypothetical protein